jgi:hypothetical protein
MLFTTRPYRPLLPLVYRSSACVLITLLLLSAGPVYAEWIAMEDKYQTPRLRTLYFDPDTIRREGNLVTLEMLVDWKSMQGNRSPNRFYSTKNTKEFDCARTLVRSLASIDFDGRMGTGRPVGGGAFTNEMSWVPVEPGSLNHGLWAIACGNP